ncbi:MAG: hypothetical protein E7585_03395 [Ruminococcaceae bacterium]|nr:hypothetical protein [Oscillospiraceae bacterium]
MKKLLALLIAVMMVVVLVPATMLSAMVPETSSEVGGEEGGNNPSESVTSPSDPLPGEPGDNEEGSEAENERTEEDVAALDKEFTEGEDVLALFDNNGELVGYFADFVSAAVWVRSGDTVALLADLTVSEQIVINRDLTLKGNGFAIYDATGNDYQPVIWIKDHGTDVSVSDLTVVTPNTGLLVSTTAISALFDENYEITGEPFLSANHNSSDSCRINVVLDNCQILTNVNDRHAYDNIDSAQAMADFQASSDSSVAALILHGQNVYVKITGEDSVYASNAPQHTVANLGGFLDIYDGLIYGHDAYNVLGLYGRTNISAEADNQMRSATTAIYGGRFIAGPEVGASLIRSLRGHTLVIAGGEFVQTTSGTQLIRVSDSDRAGYAYILGGDFYNDNGSTIFGAGNVDLSYVRIYGGNFFAQNNPGIATTKRPTYSFRYNGYETTDRLGVDAAYGMYIDAGYKISTFGYPESPVYNANTKIDYVKSGFHYLQSVTYDETWLITNGYIEQGFAYLVTNGEDAAPTGFYGFELERALFYLGNGGTFTLARDITWEQPAKATKGEDDYDYGVHVRCRPATAEMTFNSAAKNGYYTLTASVTNMSFFTLQGGTFRFDNIGIVNQKGGIIGTRSAGNNTVYFTGGYYEANTTGAAACDGIVLNGATTAYILGGTFTSDRASITIGDGANVYFGIEGTQQGPTLIQKNAQAIWAGGGSGMKMTFYYATFRDTGTTGNNIYIDAGAKNFELTIYDGYFYVNNKGNNQVLSAAKDATGTVNIYGGTFLRGNTGPGTNAYGKVLIFEHNGEVNLYGGHFRTLVADNTIMTIRQNTVTVTVGDEETGEGPTFQTNGGHAIQIDSNYNTNATVNIYGGVFKGSNSKSTILMGQNNSDGTVTATLNIYNGDFTAVKTILTVGDDDIANIYNGIFNSTNGGNMFVTNTNSKLYIHDGVYTKTSGNVYTPGNNSVLWVYGGSFNSTGGFSVYKGTNDHTINLGAPGSKEGPDVYAKTCLFGTSDGNDSAVYYTVYGGNYVVETTGNTIYLYGATRGAIKIYDGNFLEFGGTSRMFRIGGTFDGIVDIYGGTFEHNSTSDLLCIVDTARADVTIGREDGTGPVMTAIGQAILEVTTNATEPMHVKVLGGNLTTNGGVESVFNFNKLPAGSTVLFDNNPTITATENTAENTAATAKNTGSYAVNFNAAGSTLTINGGSYYTYGNVDTTINIKEGTATINAGYFYSNGMSVARVTGGATATTNGTTEVTTTTTAQLIIKGGLYVLAANWERNDSNNATKDSVIMAGEDDDYGTIIIDGGTFVSGSDIGRYVINKYNAASTITLNDGIFMASDVQQYYYYTGKTAENIAVDRQNNMQIVYAGKSYFTYIMSGEEAVTEYHKVTGKGEIRLMKIELGDQDQYISGIRFTTVIDEDALDLMGEQLPAELMSQVTGVQWGTLIVPADFLATTNGFLTHAALIEAGLEYQDIPADRSYEETEDGITFTAALTNIKEENYGRRFVAVGYAKLTVNNTEPDGATEYYLYAEFDEKGVSLAELAAILLENEVNAINPYSAELKALLQTFAAALPEDEIPEIKPSEPGDDDVINDPFGTDESEDEENGDGGDDDSDGAGDDNGGTGDDNGGTDE